MALDTTVPEKSRQQAHVRVVGICATCSTAIPYPRPNQRFCSGKCRAAASRQAKASRMVEDLRELQRRLDRLVAEWGGRK